MPTAMQHTHASPHLRDFIIADGHASEIQQLLQGASAPTLVLHDAGAALERITTALAGMHVGTLHVVAHGSACGISLGGQWIDAQTLEKSAHLLVHWRVQRIALWSCELGQDTQWLEKLRRLTGAEVFASKDRLGWDARTGQRNWSLRSGGRQQGEALLALPFSLPVLAAWNHQLVTLKVQGIYATTASGAPDHFYADETSSVTINTTALSTTNVTFSQAGTQFSGNNVLGTVSYGPSGSVTTMANVLASRPIKVGGVVKGFYVWLDNDHSGTGTAGDTAYILSLDNSYFNATSSIGSSSDRVDSALNSVLPVNSPPVGVNDSATFLEDSVAQTGNVLTNDTDANGDTLSVTGFSINGVSGTLGSAFSISGVGSFTLQSTGDYSFTPVANYAGAVPIITYTLSDGQATSTAQLSVQLTAVNDAPASANKTIAATENSSYTFSTADFALTDANDTPANTLAAVRITSLPAAGELRYNGTAITLTGGYYEVLLANLSKLTYYVASSNNAASTTFNFKVRDNGGTANGGVDLATSSNTITVNISGINTPPVAVADTATAVEVGGSVASPTAGTNPAGLVLSNDTDADGNTLTVSSVINTAATSTASTPATSSTSTSNPVSASGVYGTLKIGADGSYIYEVDNANASVQALRTSSNTLTDTFSYTISDGNGGTSTSTLTVTIQGANDAPVGVDDKNVAKEHLSGSYDPGFNATGNVLTNDTDVDAGDGKTVAGLTATATGTTSGTSTTTVSLSFATGVNSSFIHTGDYVYIGNSSTPLMAGGSQVTVSANNNGVITLSNQTALSGYASGTVVGFSNKSSGQSGGTWGTATYSSSTTTTPTSQTVNTSSEVDTILVGMTVTDSGGVIPAGTTVTAVDSANHTITLNNAVSISSASLTFSKTISGTGAGGTSITGQYGTLVLGTDGVYTYTPGTDIAAIAQGQTAIDKFSYKVTDTASLTSTAVLTITVQGSGTSDPKANADAVTAVETGMVAGSSPSGNVLTGTGTTGAVADTTPSGTLTVTSAKKAADATDTAVGTNTAITGVYGTLTISSTGAYTYTNFDSNAAVNALRTSSDKLTDTFTYTASNGTQTSTTTLTVTITGANDAPVGVADATTATEAGGTANGTAGVNPTGNVLSNDTDVDTGDTRTVSMAGTSSASTAVTTGTTSANGLSVTGTYGVLKLGADGSYTYTVTQGNASVQALLPSSAPLTDTFTYQLTDAAGATSTTTLTVSVYGANDAPVNTVPGTSPTVAESGTVAITGVSVSDVDSPSITTKLTVLNGTVHIGTLGGATISAGSDNSATLTLSGTPAQVAAALGTLSYTGAAYFSGTDTLGMVTTDSGGLTATSTLDLSVTPDNRTLTVTGTGVNEASPYVFFTVGGVSGQKVTLAAAGVASGASATSGLDFLANIEYFDGTAWVAYTGAAVALPGATMLVRMPVLQDNVYEGVESLQLTATNTYGTAVTNTSTIRDDGTGAIYLTSNTSGTANASGDAGYPSALDDDRTLTVNSITVNEASTHAVFKVDGTVGQVITLALVTGSATYQTDYATGGVTLQFWDTTLATPAWVAYTSSATIPAGGSLFVRTTIFNDAIYEGAENFGLKATNGSGLASVGTAIIVDNGTGLIYDGTITGGAATTSNTGLDNDLSVVVNAYGPVNEGSTYAMFKVTATAGENLSLALTASGGRAANVAGFTTIEFYDTGTSSWKTYSSTVQPVVPGALQSGTGDVLVRVNITSEQDNIYEGAETFTLTASTATGTGLSSGAEATIIDDGTGTKYDGTLSSTSPVTPAADVTTLDNDKPALSINDMTVSEASDCVVVRVSLSKASAFDVGFTPSLLDVSTNTQDHGANIEYLQGSTWTSAASGVTIAAGSTSVLLRTTITQDNVFEGAETFQFSSGAITGVVNNPTGASGTVTIVDDGSSGNVFSSTSTTSTPTAGTADDDRPTVSVSGNAVTEGGLLVYTVSIDKQSTQAISFTPTWGASGDTASTSGGTPDVNLSFSTDAGAHWNAFGSAVTIAPGTSSVAIQVQTIDDLVAEPQEKLTLVTGNITAGTVKNASGASGAAYINDNDTVPTIAISSNKNTLKAGETATLTFTLSDASTDFLNSSVTVSGGTLGALSGSGSSYSATFTPNANSTTNGVVSVASNKFTNASGIANADGADANNTVTMTVDTLPPVAPTVTSQTTTNLHPTITGTATLGAGETLSVTVNGATYNNVTVTAGSWSIDTGTAPVSSGTLGNFVGGQTYSVAATATDAAGNASTDVTSGELTIAAANLVLGAISAHTTEAGGTATFTVKLNSQPASDVTVTVASSNTAEGTVGPTTLTFTSANWNTAQTVTVTGVDDTVVDGNITYAANLSASSTDTNYNGKTGTVSVVNDDNDSSTLSVSSVVVSEASPYAVVQASLSHVLPAVLTFTPSLLGGTATVGTDTGSGLEYFNGTAWVSAASGVTMAAGASSVLLRTSIVNDTVYEGSESFSIRTGTITGTVTNTSGASGTVTIKDDGSNGNVFFSNNNTNTATTGTADNDQPTISVSSVTVSEAQPYAQVSVSLSNTSTSPVQFTPAMNGGTAQGQATIGTDTGSVLQYFDGSNWLSAASGVTIAAGSQSVQLRVAIVQDTLYNEGVEKFTISTGSITGAVANTAGASGTVSIKDVTALADPVITNVLEDSPPDPTPYDLLTAKTLQVVTVTGEPGCTVTLYKLDGSGNPVANGTSFVSTEPTAGTYTLDFGANALAAGDYEVRLNKSGYNSNYSNSFTIDSTPGLYDITGQRANVKISDAVTVTNGAVGGMDQNRFPTFWNGTDWLDADGDKIRFTQDTLLTFNKAAAPADSVVTSTATSGSTLALHTQTGTYTYTPSATALSNGGIDTFKVYASDGNKGAYLNLTFDPKDSLDRDGIPASVETNLATLAGNNGDLNNDGIQDATENAVTTLAWTTVDKFNSALNGTLTSSAPVISVVVAQSTTGSAVDTSSQLSDVKVLAPNSATTGGSKPANATWDPIQFAVEPLQSMGLQDVDPSRVGTQVRVVLDVSRSQMPASSFNGYMKYVNQAAVNMHITDLNGNAITTPGWYDFTQKVAGGDGARFITAGGLITAIELIITDNAFGDDDPTVGRIYDPGVPVNNSSSGSGGGGGYVYSPVVPTVVFQTTSNTHPIINGTATLGSNETLTVVVNGATYTNVPVSLGHWFINTATAVPSTGILSNFANGSYSVTATVQDLAGNASTDVTSNELTIVTALPAVPTVDSQTTNNTHPVLTGTATLAAGETLTVVVNGATYTNVPVTAGHWSLNTATATPASGTLGNFVDGRYPVTATARDGAGNASTDITTNELTIDLTPPAVPTVDSQTTTNTHPVITGTATLAAGETLTVVLNGATYTNVPVSAGRWSLDTATVSPTSGTLGQLLAGNSYAVTATARDALGNASTDITTNELVITAVVPVVDPPSTGGGLPAPAPSHVTPMYAVVLPGGDRWLSSVQADAHGLATTFSSGQAVVDFLVSSVATSDTLALQAWRNVVTGDYVYLPANAKLPYACYVPNAETVLGYVPAAGHGAFDVHLYLTAQGLTQLMGQAQASQAGLLTHGYVDLGAVFASMAPDASAASVPLVGQVVAV